MWICRHCAAHVKDDMLKCPCCATPAPARLQPELADHITDEAREPPRSSPISWLALNRFPELRKKAQSPWVWALFGLVLGLGCGCIDFHGSLSDPLAFGGTLALVFGLLGATLRWRRNRWYDREQRNTPAAETGAILAFFLIFVLAVIDAFSHHRGGKSLDYLGSILCPVLFFGIVSALTGALASGAVVLLWKRIGRRLIRRISRGRWGESAPREAREKIRLAGRHDYPDGTEHSDGITIGSPQFVPRGDAHSDIRPEPSDGPIWRDMPPEPEA